MNILQSKIMTKYENSQLNEPNNNELQRYLFLDVDGVLNTVNYSNYLLEDEFDEDGALFDPEAVDNLATILSNVPTVKLIISSTWRLKGWEWMNKMWEKRQMPGSIYDFTPRLEFTRFVDIIHKKYSESVYPSGTRGLEIGEWLRLHAPRNSMQYKYAIIDDEDDFPTFIQDYVILTDPNMGITKDVAMKAIEKLL